MEVIIDTNVFMYAIFDQLHNEDCWEILHMVRKKEITPVVSEGLFREYVFVPAKMSIKILEQKFNDHSLELKDFNQANQDVYDCCSTMMKIMMDNSKNIVVTSKQKICPDPEDDKLINLAIDSNCNKIITKNMSDLKCAEDNCIRTKSGKIIEIDTPENFIRAFRLQKHFRDKSTSKGMR